MEFTVLGMGKTGHAATCYLLSKGQNVTVWDRSKEKLQTLRENGIDIYGQVVGKYSPKVEEDIGKAIKNSKYILVFTTANGHRPIAELLKNQLQEDQKIIIFNGNWGTVEFVETLQKEVLDKHITIAETGQQIFAASLQGTGHSYLKSLKKAVDIGSYPKEGVTAIVDEMSSLFPQFRPVGNVLETSMNMSNPVAHCSLDMFNLSLIDSGKEVLMFASTYTSPKGVDYTAHIDAERLALLNKIGVKAQSLLQLFNKSWASDYKDLYTAFKSIKSYQTAKSPTTFSSRHFTEDIPFGIYPIHKLAQKYGIPTPYIDTMLDLYVLILGKGVLEGTPKLDEVDLKKYL